MKYKSITTLLIIICCFSFASCNTDFNASNIETAPDIQSGTPNGGSASINFTEVKAEPGLNKSDIEGANYYNRETMVSDGSRLYFTMPDYGYSIVSCDMHGNDAKIVAGSNNIRIEETGEIFRGSLWQLKIINDTLYFVAVDEGLFIIPISGGNAVRLIKGDIYNYIIKDNIIYFTDFKRNEHYVLKRYDIDTEKATEIDRLSAGKELLKLGGYIVGFDNDELVYTQRDENYRREYLRYSADGQVKPISYEEGQRIETEMARRNIRPLDDESSEVNHVEGKSLSIEYGISSPNLLFLVDGEDKQLIAKVKGDYVFLLGNDIFILDRESNIERVIFQ